MGANYMETMLGVIKFKSSFLCRGDVLGKAFKSNIGSQNVEIIFPCLPKLKINPITKQLNATQLCIPPELKIKKLPNTELGVITVYYQNDVEDLKQIGAQVSQLFLRCEVKDDNLQSAADEIYSNIEEWRTQFLKLTYLMTKQLPDIYKQELYDRGCQGTGIELCTAAPSKKKISHKIYMTIGGSFQSLDRALTCEATDKICHYINVNKKFKTEYELFIMSHVQRSLGNTRYAIVEGASAIEMCICNKIKEICLDKNIDADILLEKFYRSLGDRFGLLKALKVKLPDKDPNDKITKVRNNLQHNRCLKPTQKECDEFISEIEKYLTAFSPDYFEEN